MPYWSRMGRKESGKRKMGVREGKKAEIGGELILPQAFLGSLRSPISLGACSHECIFVTLDPLHTRFDFQPLSETDFTAHKSGFRLSLYFCERWYAQAHPPPHLENLRFYLFLLRAFVTKTLTVEW